MYGRIFPGVLVILSTWKSESLDYLKKFDGLSNCKVVLNDFPENAGYLNLNYQITSSLGGIRHAMECGKEYVLKSRTDFRITDSSSIDMLFNFVYSYSAISDKQKSRIVLFNSMLLQPYAAYDFFVFGACADLEKYYNYAWSDYKGGKVDSNVLEAAKISYRQSFELGGGENGFLIPYVRYLKETCDCDLEQWWEDLGKFFISLPLRILAPVWRKYDYNFEESNLNMTCRRELLGSHEIDRSIVEFGMWQDMYNGKFILNSKDYEGILNKPM